MDAQLGRPDEFEVHPVMTSQAAALKIGPKLVEMTRTSHAIDSDICSGTYSRLSLRVITKAGAQYQWQHEFSACIEFISHRSVWRSIS